MRRFFVLIVLLSLSVVLSAQNDTATIYGHLSDDNGHSIGLINILIEGTTIGTSSNDDGNYRLQVPADTPITIQYSFIGFKTQKKTVTLKPNASLRLNLTLHQEANRLIEVSVSDIQQRNDNMTRINPRIVNSIPSPDGGIETILKTLPGVSSNNELSSQYSVRGGNYEENLIYVNDIEIYHPLLIRSGQQEGLSFVNPDMVGSILFSAGGFDAKYGDKMSSVLDIRYKKPYLFGASVYGSLLGGGLHLEGTSKNRLFSYNIGSRYKTNSYLLGSLDTKGDYKPQFFDFQGLFSYEFSEKLSLSYLSYLSNNIYSFIPSTRDTRFGTVSEALSLRIYFDGSEADQFTNTTQALSLQYNPKENIKLNFITSAYLSNEKETYDIMGQYFINELDKELGSDNMGDSSMNIGVGTFLNHARNYLNTYVYNIYHKGEWKLKNHKWQWGTKWQQEWIYDQISEWQMLDSAGYSLPYSDTSVNLFYTLKTQNTIISNRITAYIQDNYSTDFDKFRLQIIGGIRSHYWSFINKNVISPRFAFIIKPHWNRDIQFRFATGYYYQMPFYKEMRRLDGSINQNIKPERAIHYVLGADYNITIWNRPFKLLSEIYYKQLTDLIPYQIDNVRIRYYGSNNAKGYATGFDFKINGEFVKGIESWASVSVMQTQEDILDDSYIDSTGNTIYPGYIPRPTDQLVNFALFFQDYLPKYPAFKMHLALYFGSGLPFGPPNQPRYKAVFRLPAYRRVDIGFAYHLKNESTQFSKLTWFNAVKSAWLTLEVFNLLDINNTISYIWVTDIRARQYGVPNYLTSRRLNLKLTLTF
jgi:hypothetical protein